MPSFITALIAIIALAVASAQAQVPVRTETIRRPVQSAPAPQSAPSSPEIIADCSRLPPPVARMRERIVAAARSGDLQKLAAIMHGGTTMPVFTSSNDRDPVAYWKRNYPDSDGVEILSILLGIMEMGCVHAERGTPQETYIWPYLVSLPLGKLTSQQKVDLFRVMTGSDYKEMSVTGNYQFYRVGIAPDGTWQFFVAGE